MEYSQKLDTLREGIVGDYASYQVFKRMFDVPNLSFYQFGLLKDMILDLMRRKGIR